MAGTKKPNAGNKDKSAGSKDTKKKKDKGEGEDQRKQRLQLCSKWAAGIKNYSKFQSSHSSRSCKANRC